MQQAAVRLVASRGLGALSLRTLAEMPDLDVTRSAPLHYFGSSVGLLAAISTHGFEELHRLLIEQRKRDPGNVVGLAQRYGQFGLANPHLYRAMHAASVWTSIAQRGLRRSASTERARRGAVPWLERAQAARDAAFYEFAEAVQQAQSEGRLRPGEDAGKLARVLSALVDGFLFQTLEEQVGAGQSPSERLAALRQLLTLAVTGLASPSRVTRDTRGRLASD
jgi:AcrR family transcriptional regulator